MNFEEYKKDVLIYNMTFNKFIQYYNDILNMQKNNDAEKAIAYAEILSYATVAPITKYETIMLKGYVHSLKSLVEEAALKNQDKVSRR